MPEFLPPEEHKDIPAPSSWASNFYFCYEKEGKRGCPSKGRACGKLTRGLAPPHVCVEVTTGQPAQGSTLLSPSCCRWALKELLVGLCFGRHDMTRRNTSSTGSSRPSVQGRCLRAQVSQRLLSLCPGTEPRVWKWKTEPLPEFHPLLCQAEEERQI